MIDYTKYITINPEQRSGKPCIRGMRITVYDVLSYMAAGDSMEEIIDEFPHADKGGYFGMLSLCCRC
jgi:uncharacterized protein (DUF433 family)